MRLRLPPAPPPAPSSELPPELRWDAPAPTPIVLLGRREVLKALVAATAIAAAPVVGLRRTWAATRGRFFTAHERATLGALCDRIIPPDDAPGARALGAPAYIEGLLTAFDRRVPRIFAGGPFSNRNPYPDLDTGTASRRRPRNAFRHFVPLTRLQELRWRAEIFGSDKVRGADFGDAAAGGPLVGLRTVYRAGLKKVDQAAQAMAGKRFAALADADQDRVLRALDGGAFPRDPRRGNATFVDILIQHTLEGCFAVPEYGGNRHVGGWRLVGLEGDSQPLGYSLFSHALGDYVRPNSRPDHPMATPNPDELAGPVPLTPDGQRVQQTILSLTALLGE